MMFSVVITMAGDSLRCKTVKNKNLEMLGNKPVFMHSYDLFKSYKAEIIIVARACDIDEIKKYVDSDTIITIGGKTRSESVYNGVCKCHNDIVLIHDGARPFISKCIVDQILDGMKEYRAVYAAIPLKDTIRMDGETLKRDQLKAAQTPQAFYTNDIKKALKKAIDEHIVITDDIEAIEKCSDIKYIDVLGSDENFKITTPLDLKLAKMFLGDKKND